MAAKSKRMKANEEAYDSSRKYRPREAMAALKGMRKAKFDESVDVSVVLGIDARKSDQFVRGSMVLPHGIGKVVKVLVFAEGEDVEKAKAAGAEEAGGDSLIDEMEKNGCPFDVTIATFAMMPKVARIGRVLGPAGLMPNPKDGTVTDNVEKAVKKALAGQIKYRADKGGVVHAIIGCASFSDTALLENLAAFISELQRAKPSAAKGTYLRGVYVSLTMGPAIKLEPVF